ncbi:hypothetical protein L2E82_47457 [Cichorium intybus]|uniref:Uncharacterized protein n=1 Tax=Cichorium intybus TaxID=13427 RepID=A0ACB8YUU7_CICIN|nr:hypothetical protein L2E82_47457 [Cichorium intybus]
MVATSRSLNNEFYGPTGPEASQAQAFTFLVRDQRLGANVGSAQGPTGLDANTTSVWISPLSMLSLDLVISQSNICVAAIRRFLSYADSSPQIQSHSHCQQVFVIEGELKIRNLEGVSLSSRLFYAKVTLLVCGRGGLSKYFEIEAKFYFEAVRELIVHMGKSLAFLDISSAWGGLNYFISDFECNEEGRFSYPFSCLECLQKIDYFGLLFVYWFPNLDILTYQREYTYESYDAMGPKDLMLAHSCSHFSSFLSSTLG